MNHLSDRNSERFPWVTLVMLGLLAIAGSLLVAWVADVRGVSQLFARLQMWQDAPHWLLDVPEISRQYLLLPTLALVTIAIAVMHLSPVPQTWSRVVIVGILLALTLRYLLWRSLSTLNLSNPLDGAFSIALLLMEFSVIFSNSWQLYLNLKVKLRTREANRLSQAVLAGDYIPSVDILIPTYDEPAAILRRTLIGCQALDYPNKQVYLLDDTRRPEIKALAAQLGCHYITRPHNLHAKAGNLNHAIAQTSGELIAVFDADFIPTTNFLTRTVGFFQQAKIALVQTHQSFYNTDPVARNLGIQNWVPQEVEVFSRYYQVLRDSVETALCYGSSFVARRSALEKIGGFVTDSLSEDYYTSVRLSANGDRVIYLNESLSAGLCAENMAGHILQRLRWARGTLQGFFIAANPLRIPGLSFMQRLAHFEGMVQWFTSTFRLFFLLAPLAYTFLGVSPFNTTFAALFYFFFPYYLIQLLSYSWLNYRSRSALLSDIYSVAQCIPVSLTVVQTLFKPFGKSFQVTPKGTSRDRYQFNWSLAFPLIILLIATSVCLLDNLSVLKPYYFSSNGLIPTPTTQIAEAQWSFFWNSYNLLVLGVALIVLVDIPKPDIYEWFPLQRIVKILPQENGREVWGMTAKISEAGTQIILSETGNFPEYFSDTVQLEFVESGLQLSGKVLQRGSQLSIQFQEMDDAQYFQLVKLLFCQPERWKPLQTPNELRSLFLLLIALSQPLKPAYSWIQTQQRRICNRRHHQIVTRH
ncbi:glycosyltransferase [Desertifilum sp. FACHB-1129]|uniref:Cellulose synthase catalytic subunit n=2 Tax=Desertifilum tharense IPPAS B-1220 TaxID=1781255 RepID=A0A1E5QLB1_9CYAN|nr:MULTISPECIES: glycosyltransferase [Desertifilum]MDA0209926.1 glycosyltransferase [Cyanobacteria bacterium FC1]MBD2313806.1 glycosyltransferase [Desertifilum sp. FACHB-1129]MBD2324483.1 glycosyltransferase [Desertifilum sp. FACHB-866]MBD2334497.1 glycosyltransferase [Desertifilum sp. FACHB-868]OEJ75466.1 cellulose synthase catalytic subunit [Desertifilum tharense IPPAS B-1220]